MVPKLGIAFIVNLLFIVDLFDGEWPLLRFFVPLLVMIGVPLPDDPRLYDTDVDSPRGLLWWTIAIASAAFAVVSLSMMRRAPRRTGAESLAPARYPSPPPSTDDDSPAVARLIGRAGQFKDVTIDIPAGGLTLGRDPGPGAGLRFADDSDLSRRHCTITYLPSARCFRVVDLGSANGTFVIPEQRRLRANEPWDCAARQVIRLGLHNVIELLPR